MNLDDMPAQSTGRVSLETVGEMRYMNYAIAFRAVQERMCKDEFIRWLLDEHERMARRYGQMGALSPSPLPTGNPPPAFPRH
jgi:hypothetical protein